MDKFEYYQAIMTLKEHAAGESIPVKKPRVKVNNSLRELLVHKKEPYTR